jgi:hypothetical protein
MSETHLLIEIIERLKRIESHTEKIMTDQATFDAQLVESISGIDWEISESRNRLQAHPVGYRFPLLGCDPSDGLDASFRQAAIQLRSNIAKIIKKEGKNLLQEAAKEENFREGTWRV